MLDPFPRLGKDGKANVKFIAAWHCHLGSNSCSSAVQDDEVMMLADGDDVAKLLGEGQSWKLEFACTYILFSWLRSEGTECSDWQAKKYIKVMCIVPTRKAAVHVYRITSIVNSYQSIYHIYQPLQLRLCMPVIWAPPLVRSRAPKGEEHFNFLCPQLSGLRSRFRWKSKAYVWR